MTTQCELNRPGTAGSINELSLYDSASTPPTIDYIARVWQEDTDEELSIALANTSDFTEFMLNLLDENKLLKKIVKNLWNTVQYDNEYSSFLLGQYTKDEFVNIARQFAVQPSNDIRTDDLYRSVKVVHSTIDASLSSHDLGTMLNIDCSYIEKIMSNKNVTQSI